MEQDIGEDVMSMHMSRVKPNNRYLSRAKTEIGLLNRAGFFWVILFVSRSEGSQGLKVSPCRVNVGRFFVVSYVVLCCSISPI